MFAYSPPSALSCVFLCRSSWQIADSFRRFGISETTKDLLVVKVSPTETSCKEAVAEHLTAHVQGTPVDFTDENIAAVMDLERVRKTYKISLAQGQNKRHGNAKPDAVYGTGNATAIATTTNDHTQDRNERKEVEVVVLGMMAIKGS